MPDHRLPAPAKHELRSEMRRRRRLVDDARGRSATIWDHVRALPEVDRATTIMVFNSIIGEPDTGPFVEWAITARKSMSVPEDDVDPAWPDVVIVPGLAFTSSGQRLGQGGGWYDRFLPGIRSTCRTIGVCFHEQLVDSLPIEPHDVQLDVVVTERGVAAPDRHDDTPEA